MKCSVLVFDLGKVLVDFDYAIAARRIVPLCTSPADPAAFFSKHAELLNRYELGKLTTQGFFDQIKAATGFSGEQAEFNAFFADIFTPIQPMIDLFGELKKTKLPTYIFSNTNDLAVEHIRKRFPFFSDFDAYVLSYEHGAMKPATKLYQIVEQMSGRRGAEILYIDDRAENVAAGVARGWQGVLHESPRSTREALQKLGILG
ncbi:MAG TPA: HAD family phosphatase [Verrucomicrobiae bacterium]|jgi:HAD superfamily hydrolase (TIGR01509 family)|nr:HAD family phosphatase [Verrucomicrobiae bacterium]